MFDGDLYLLTSNQRKADELSDLLGRPVLRGEGHVSEVQGLDVVAVAREKAAEAYRQVGKPIIVDDTGLVVLSWNGLPGALVSWFLDSVGVDGILRMLATEPDRRATAMTALAYADGHQTEVFLGVIEGVISDASRGEGGFGFDPIFVPRGEDRTLAEMTHAEKNAISMRAAAAAELGAWLARHHG